MKATVASPWANKFVQAQGIHIAHIKAQVVTYAALSVQVRECTSYSNHADCATRVMTYDV